MVGHSRRHASHLNPLESLTQYPDASARNIISTDSYSPPNLSPKYDRLTKVYRSLYNGFNSSQCLKATSQSVMIDFTVTAPNISKNAVLMVRRFLFLSFRIIVCFVNLSVATQRTHELSLETVKSNL